MDASSVTSAVHRPGRGRVFDSIVDAIGDTPIVRLRKMPQQHGANATILAKLEYFNPAASVRSEEHTSELQSPDHLVCRLLLEKKNTSNEYPPAEPPLRPQTTRPS